MDDSTHPCNILHGEYVQSIWAFHQHVQHVLRLSALVENLRCGPSAWSFKLGLAFDTSICAFHLVLLYALHAGFELRAGDVCLIQS
jgi:hypothetical protein